MIEIFDVQLVPLCHEKIEQVRRWRTDPQISQYMGTQIEITPSMQEKWFKRINNRNNYYFIVVFDNTEVGVVNIRNIDYDTKEGEIGIFIVDDCVRPYHVSYKSYLGMIDYGFNEIGLKVISALILSDNIRSIKFHKKFGFILDENQEGVYNQKYTLTQEAYIIHRKRVIDTLGIR